MSNNFDKKMVEKFIKESVKELRNGFQGCFTLKLDDRLAVCAGWSAGHGGKKRDDAIQDTNDLDYAINVGIKVYTSDALLIDYDFINYPYYEDGDIMDSGISITANENYEMLVDHLEQYYRSLENFNISLRGEISVKEN